MTVIGSRGIETDLTNIYVLKYRVLMTWVFFHLLVRDIMDLDGGGCRNMTESPYFLAIQK